MAPIKAIAESICASVGSDCTTTTVTTLGDYLLPKPKSENTRPVASKVKRTVAPSKPSSKAALATNTKLKNKRTVSVKEDTLDHGAETGLTPKERSILATEVINATLKVLNDAIKAPLQTAVRRQPCSKEGTQRKTLRRSISMPQSPLQPRSLNRVASSPGLSNRSSRSSSTASIKIASHRSTAECARVAFACLRSLQAAGIPGVDFLHLQLENGTSALIGKLIALGLDDLALKEIRILKRRLVPADASKESGPKTTGAPIQELAELLNFGDIVSVDRQTLNLVISTQLHIVRLLASTRKQNIRDTLEVLNPHHQSSPTRLLLLIAEDPKSRDKAVRQLQALSDTLLSLCPSVASSDDDLALETRISVPPDVAFQLQTIALHNRLQWWKIAKHAADYSKNLIQPFHRCLSTFARRSENGALGAARSAAESFRSLCQIWSRQTSFEEQATHSAVFEIHRLLSSLSQEAGDVEEALLWTRKLKEYTGKITQARKVTIATRVVALVLKRPARNPEDEKVLSELLELLNASYTGTSADIDDLMTEISAARRSALAVLSRSTPTCRPEDRLEERMQNMCEALIFLCPRICLRYLGKPITAESQTKETIIYEQKRLYIAKSAYHTIDSTLFLAKTLLGGNRLSWDILDSRLQECLSLLDRLDPDNILSKAESVAPHSYYVKISNLYYTHFLNERRKPDGQKEAQQLNILRRSVDCVQARSPVEKRAALYSMKLERMADIYKTAGKFEELFDVVKKMQDVQMADGVLSNIASAMKTIPVCPAWETDEQTTLLGRTVHTLLKVQLKYLRQTTNEVNLDESLSAEEQGALLEYQLVHLRTQTKDLSVVSRFQSMVFKSLLALYVTEQFPVRRLRVLVELLSLDTELQEKISKSISDELQYAIAETVKIEQSKDQGLQPYWQHLQTLALSVLELQQQQPNVTLLKRYVATWSSIQKECQSAEALRQRVDDVHGLLDQLKNMSIYCQVRGHDEFRVTILSLVSDLHSKIETTSSSADDAVSNLIDLGAQWLQLGYSGKAGFALDKAHRKCDQSGISTKIMLKLHVNYSDYLQTIGNFDKSEEYLRRAKEFYITDDAVPSQRGKSKPTQLLSEAYLVQSKIALSRGAAHIALAQAKKSVRLLRRAWARVEEQRRRKKSSQNFPSSDSGLGALADGVSNLSISTASTSEELELPSSNIQSCLWVFIDPLFRGLEHLSGVYAYHGMFQETIYYAEQGYKLAKDMNSDSHQAMAAAIIGVAMMKAGSLERGSELLMESKKFSSAVQGNRNAATLAYYTGRMHGILGDQTSELSSYELAESILDTILHSKSDEQGVTDHSAQAIEASMAMVSISKSKPTTKRKPVSRAKVPPKTKKPLPRTKTPISDAPASIVEECTHIVSFQAVILRSKSQVLNSMKRFGEVQTLLDRAAGSVLTQTEAVDQKLAMAKQLLSQSLEFMIADPVYSILQDSTISFPSVSNNSKADVSGDQVATTKTTPPKRGTAAKSGRGLARVRPSSDDCFEKLRQAQEYLLEAHSIAVTAAPLVMIHTISAMLNTVSILLSASGHTKGLSMLSPGFASCTIETARTTSIRRERKAILADPSSNTKMDELIWPTATPGESRRVSLAAPQDFSRFQKDYIDIIPQAWTAISIALSDSHNELVITRLQAGQSPFVLRLPLGRHNSMDADEDVFGFEQGRCELQEIIDLANESAHSARDMSSKEARIQWWEERDELDSRMKELLENIEKVWLGGFTGIFSQQSRHPDLLARFQKSFQNILDKHLPSRQKTGKRGTPAPKVALDSRILELFIGLGDASDEDCDFSEPLTDLLYFVVDILQFHGELNAYAEIDFDSITIETHDALRCYHDSLHGSGHVDIGKHTILILDKALHAFPWESLPCLNGQAVSRLPSLGCLRDRILLQRGQASDGCPDGHYVDRQNGSYILNPAGDLKNTQATFEKSLQDLDNWDGIVKREPKEEEIKENLVSKDLFLYFGHGSGAQYIRAREIRRLEKCSVTFLMGCSSGTLVDAAEFEAYGPAINYMHAGCPALVATLWDVTDKDIDRFAKSTFESWGLFQAECSIEKRGKGKKKAQHPSTEKVSLVEAVAKGREACNLRYLNAAAVCVYGVPVYLK